LPKYQLGIAYVLTLVVFLAIDMMWLGFAAKGLYRKHLGGFLSENVNWTAAIIFYMLYIVGIFIFCISPSVEKQSLKHAILMGALFGFFCYATYDLTNLATLKDWPTAIVYIDIIWGAFLTAAVSASGYGIVRWLQ
jgi:uncharacterized membrane protein